MTNQDDAAKQAIGVIHIAHSAFGLAPFRAFLESYRSQPAGAAHTLLIAFKGFTSRALMEPFTDLLIGMDVQVIEQSDEGYDIGSYFDIIRTTRYEVYCCLNSRSRLLAGNWLATLLAALEPESVGIAGATASRESLFTDHLANGRGEAARRARGIRAWLRRSPINDLRHWIKFPPFPNSHLRTNAFVLRRATALAVDPGKIVRRAQTAAFENGRRSVTRQLAKAGLRAVVVGRDGRVFNTDDWAGSGTFWQAGQNNLLVADNQTDRYDVADAETRAILAKRAWGSSGLPSRVPANQICSQSE